MAQISRVSRGAGATAQTAVDGAWQQAGEPQQMMACSTAAKSSRRRGAARLELGHHEKQ